MASIGTDCSVTYYLRRKRIRRIAFPFDWTVTPIPASLELIQNNFNDFLNEENLIFLPPVKRLLFEEDGRTLKVANDYITPVVCEKYGILFPHDFSIRGRADLPDVQTKYRRRIVRFMEVITNAPPLALIYNNCMPNDWQLEQYKKAGTPYRRLDTDQLTPILDSFAEKYPSISVMDFQSLQMRIDGKKSV